MDGIFEKLSYLELKLADNIFFASIKSYLSQSHFSCAMVADSDAMFQY